MKTPNAERRTLNVQSRSPAPVWDFGVRCSMFDVRCFLVRLLALLPLALATVLTAAPPLNPANIYTNGLRTRDGIGKYILGREIAHYMTHEGADWLERPEREDEERPSQLLEALQLKPGDAVADIGAGSGYLSWRMGKLVGPGGRVFANDIQPEMLVILRTNATAHGVTNVVPILGTDSDPKLPTNAVDLAIMVDVYHEFAHPIEMMQGIVRSLKPGGRVVFVEYRGEDPSVPIKPLHKMTEAQVKKEMALLPLEWVETRRELPRQHVIVFRKRNTE
jgi:ubiquinone/menaquinone biosynthesis C-methylase UbiE